MSREASRSDVGGRSVRAWTAAALIVCASALMAQTTFRNINGTVKDRHHEPLRGAVVQIENENTHSVVSVITDQNGSYSYKRLQGETDYLVWCTYRGQRSKTKELSLFNTKKNPKIDLTVRLP